MKRQQPYDQLLSAAVTKETRKLFIALAEARGRSTAEELRDAIRAHLEAAGLEPDR